MKIQGSNVLITGGASGIGKLMGQIALEKGANALIIWDINEKNIEATVQELSFKGKVFAQRVDVGDMDSVHAAYGIARQQCGDVDVLINCAGIVTSNRTFDKVEVSEIDRTIRINTIAPMYVAHEILPDMVARGRGHICTIASAAGMLGNPGIATRMFGALAEAQVNIDAISTSEISISCLIKGSQLKEAANAIHKEFFPEK